MYLIFALTLFCSIHTVFSDDNSTDTRSLFGTSPRRDLPFMELAKYDGYTAEEHFVTTSDGYILGVFRIPVNKNCSASNGTIMFMHGLYLSGDDCLIPGPKKGHCQIYADNCYDVWVPNVRGNFYSRNHTQLNPETDSEFWNFAIDEMALRDLPAVIDYVLQTTGETKISYVAHSQGVGLLLILCSKRPEYNNKIKVGFGIGPAAWMHNSKSIVAKILGHFASVIPQSDDPILNKEVLARNGVIQNAGELLCGSTNLAYPFCSAFIFALLGYNKFQTTKELLPVVVGHGPSGSSLRNAHRWGQIVNNGFSEYDYGHIKNRLFYGQRSPPSYDLYPVTMRWVLLASVNDYIVNLSDVKKLESKLRNVSLCVLSDKTFGHFDFIYDKDIPNYITPVILSTIKTGTYICP